LYDGRVLTSGGLRGGLVHKESQKSYFNKVYLTEGTAVGKQKQAARKRRGRILRGAWQRWQ